METGAMVWKTDNDIQEKIEKSNQFELFWSNPTRKTLQHGFYES